mgnify:CR=1 FL=1
MDKEQGKGRGLGGGFQRAVQWLGLVLIGVVLTACGSLQPTKPQEPDLPPTAERREVRLGLALGGGAARGRFAGSALPQRVAPMAARRLRTGGGPAQQQHRRTTPERG